MDEKDFNEEEDLQTEETKYPPIVDKEPDEVEDKEDDEDEDDEEEVEEQNTQVKEEEVDVEETEEETTDDGQHGEEPTGGPGAEEEKEEPKEEVKPLPPNQQPHPVHLEDIVDYGESNVPQNFDYSVLTGRDVQFEYQGHTINAPVINVEQKQNEGTGRLDTRILIRQNGELKWFDVDGRFKLIKY